MLEWLTRLFKGTVSGEGSGEAGTRNDPEVVKKTQVDLSVPRELSPVDSPTIQARFKTMGIFDTLDPNREQDLKRIILTRCRERHTEIWWWSLREFLRIKKSHKGEMPFQVVTADCEMFMHVKERIFALEELVRAEGVQFRNIRTNEGELMHDRTPVTDGEYRVRYMIRELEGFVPITLREGTLDVPLLVRQLNGICRAQRWSYRLVLLPPQENTYCVLRCNIAAAERTAATQWGSLEYPGYSVGHMN